MRRRRRCAPTAARAQPKTSTEPLADGWLASVAMLGFAQGPDADLGAGAEASVRGLLMAARPIVADMGERLRST
jgi:hypothetical protein